MGFRVFGSAEVLSVHTGAEQLAAHVRKEAHRAVFSYVPQEGMVYVRSRAISSRCNDNFDFFGAEEIEKAYETFIGKPVFVNHHNSNHKQMRGLIIDAALHRDRNPDGSPDTWVEVLMEIDGYKYPKLAKALIKGDIDRTSMGCDVEISKCSVCGNTARNPREYCRHIPKMKGSKVFQLQPDGTRVAKLVYEECYGLSFFENSVLVEPPADPTAFRLGNVVVGPGLEHLVEKTARLQDVVDEPDSTAPMTRTAMRKQAGFLDNYPSDDEIDEMREGGFGGRDPWHPYKHELASRPEPRVARPHGMSPEEEYHGPYEVVRHPDTGQYHVVDNQGRRTRYGGGGRPEGGMDDRFAAEHSRDYAEHKQRSKELARGVFEKFDRNINEILDPGSTPESRESDHRSRAITNLLNIGYHPHDIQAEREDYEPYAEVHHPSGWNIRDHGGDMLEIHHKATGDDAHDVINVTAPHDSALWETTAPWESRRAPGYGPAEAKQDLDHWYNDQETGSREHLEQHEPKIRRWKMRHQGGMERRLYAEHPSGYRAEWTGGNRFHVYEGETPVDSPPIPGYGDHLRSSEAEGVRNRFQQHHLERGLHDWVNDNGAEYMDFNHPIDPPSYGERHGYTGSLQVEAVSKGDRFFDENKIDPAHIINAFNNAKPEQRTEGMDWYQHIHRTARMITGGHVDTSKGDVVGGDPAKGAGLLAVYSGQSGLSDNHWKASTAARLNKGVGGSVKAGDPHAQPGFFADKTQAEKAQRIIEGEHHSKVLGLGSPKTAAFAKLIESGGKGDNHTVCVDRHALSVALGRRVTDADFQKSELSKAPLKDDLMEGHTENHRYRMVSDAYRHAAAELSRQHGTTIHPHQVQAVTWVGQRDLNNEVDAKSDDPKMKRLIKGRATNDRNATARWHAHVKENYPEFSDQEHWKMSSRHEAMWAPIDKRVDDLTPGDVVIAGGRFMPVKQVSFHAPGEHPESPIKNDMHAVRVHTDNGDRWSGSGRTMSTFHPDLSGEEAVPFKLRENEGFVGSRRQAYNETKAPMDVDTLRDEQCPICGNDIAYNGRQCQVCGYLSPPKGLDDPDVDKAKELDQLKDDIDDTLDSADPSRNGAPFDAGDPSQLEPGGDNSANPWLECTNCGTGIRPTAPETTGEQQPQEVGAAGPAEGDACPVCGKGELQSTGESEDDTDEQAEDEEAAEEDPDDPETDDEDESDSKKKGKSPASKPVAAMKYRDHPEEYPMQNGLASLASLAQDAKDAKTLIESQQRTIARLHRRESVHTSQIQRLTAGIQALAQRLGPEADLLVRTAMVRKHADEQNPAQPIPEPAPQPPTQSTVDAETPEAFADVRAPGMVPGVNNDVAADAVTTVYTPGQDIGTAPVRQLVDVTAPIEGTQGPRPLSEVKTLDEVRVGNPMNPQQAFPLGGDFANAQRTSAAQAPTGDLRFMSSLRLARLRMQSGIEQGSVERGDDMLIAQKIASDRARSDQQIEDEINTLNSVRRVAAASQAPLPPRGAVPRPAAVPAQRLVPQLSSVASLSTSSENDGELDAVFVG